MSDGLFLIDDEKEVETHEESWKVLIVDDDTTVHVITNASLKNKHFDGKKLNILTAMSAAEAKEILHKHDDITLALVDVVMETPNAGLDLINYIRHEMHNDMIRLVLRTGQPAQAPEEDVINMYDINDYKEKTELTTQKLYTLVRSAIKQYQQSTMLKESRDAIYKKMTINELTNLPNRMKLNEVLDSQGKKSLMLINIDDFSMINDTRGFEVGDKLLQAFSQFLKDNYQSVDHIPFYLQSDTFCLLCFNLQPHHMEKLLADFKSDIRTRHFEIDDIKLHLTVSIGIALHENGNLIQKAELALKEARNYGKNHGRIYSEDLNIIRTIYSNSLWTERIHDAIKDDKILAYFQPIKDLKTGLIKKYEALVRLKLEDDIFTPHNFIDAALYSGQIFEIFKIMLKKSCEKAVQCDAGFTINVTEYDLKEPDFFHYIKETLSHYELKPERFTLELLEYTSISHETQIQTLIQKIHDYGLLISIDDFGSHCSNFAQLNNLPIDYIKVDGSFIKEIPTCKNSQIVTKIIIDYAHQKKIPVIAEFVCDQNVYDYVKDIDADYAQGYFIGKPQEDLL